MFLVLNVRDLSPNEVIAQMTYNGRKDRIRTYSSRGNGFTIHRSSPTLPLSDNKEATYTELPQQPPTIVWTRKGKCIYDALVILLGLEPRLFAVKGDVLACYTIVPYTRLNKILASYNIYNLLINCS